MWSRETLAEHVAAGGMVEFLFFWGHTSKHSANVDVSCLSQWFLRPFEIDGTVYPSAEHFMMAEKARLFSDSLSLERILEAPAPADAKALGRGVRNYHDGRWATARVDAVLRGNLAKFGQHPDLRNFLMATNDLVLVEASPQDVVWGIGLGASDVRAARPSQWRGENLLGFALTEVRERLRVA
jgi:ribA/ribD-fused uncharacterized protein